MTHCIAATAAAALASSAMLASPMAIAGVGVPIGGCILNGTVWTRPYEPRPDETITYEVLILEPGLADGPRRRVLASERIDHVGRRVHIEVIISEYPERFPNHRLINDWREDAYGRFGPLDAGEWKVPTSVLLEDPVSGALVERTCISNIDEMNAFTVSASAPPPTLQPIAEYHHAGLDHYFMTGNATEMAALDDGVYRGWTRTGNVIPAYAPYGSGWRGKRVGRYYGRPESGLDTHFYTAANREKAALRSAPLAVDWILETEVAFELPTPETLTGTCPANTVPVYRLWNGRADSNHRYTTDLATRDAMIARDWTPEGHGPDGVALCAVLPP